MTRPPLHLVILGADGDRLHGALTLAAAEAALGGAVRVFLQLEAVALLRPPVSAPGDGARAAHGLPTLEAILADALALGVKVVACQSGLALADMDARALGHGIATGGPIAFLRGVAATDRLVCV